MQFIHCLNIASCHRFQETYSWMSFKCITIQFDSLCSKHHNFLKSNKLITEEIEMFVTLIILFSIPESFLIVHSKSIAT